MMSYDIRSNLFLLSEFLQMKPQSINSMIKKIQTYWKRMVNDLNCYIGDSSTATSFDNTGLFF